MAERDSSSDRGPLETLSLAGIGVLALVADRADELAEELAERLGMEREEVRSALKDTLSSLRREARRLGEQTGDAAAWIGEELRLAPRDAVDDLALRVAQLEHRLKLLERER
jgi:polyhydroxyalkanoate synthesis regulator phasin